MMLQGISVPLFNDGHVEVNAEATPVIIPQNKIIISSLKMLFLILLREYPVAIIKANSFFLRLKFLRSITETSHAQNHSQGTKYGKNIQVGVGNPEK
jgi:hypothetical protein